MAEYTRPTQRFTQPGLSTRPRGAQKPGRQTFHQNLRQVTPETLETRAGARLLSASPFGSAVHTLGRLNDPTAGNAVRIAGAGTSLYAAHPADPQTWGSAVDTGYGGAEYPLSIVELTPKGSSRPYAYLTDGTRQRKLNTDPTVYPIGIPAPTGPPSVSVTRPGTTVIQTIGTASDWTAAGSVAGAPSAVTRVNTTVSRIQYDFTPGTFTPATTGYCGIVPTDPTGITEGMLLAVAGETVTVDQILIAVAATTISTIVYDSGSTGACSIQPASSLGTGQIEDAPLPVYTARNPQGRYGQGIAVKRGEAGVPPQTDLATQGGRRIRQADFPVGSLVTLGSGGGAETVQILSITVGADGVQGFRCYTTGAHSAGEAITGVGPGFRCHVNSTVTAGAALTANGVHHTLTPTASASGLKMTGGIKATLGSVVDGSLTGGKATTAHDLLRLQVRVDLLTRVESIRVYLDVDRSTNDFLHNYFVHEWRASDIVSAVQGSNAASTDTFVAAGRTAAVNQQIDQLLPTGSGFLATALRESILAIGASRATPGSPLNPATADPTFQQLALGNSQWLNLECRVDQLIRVGTDSTRTLAHIKAVEILVTATTSPPAGSILAANVLVDYHGLYLTGGSGPDVGQVGDPYVYRYRYRSSITGDVSNPSPASRGGVIARRQEITLVGTASSSPQADYIDWFRLGSSLTRWTYVMTTANSGSAFGDDQSDQAIDGGETLDFLDFQPWVTLQPRQTGTCTVAGAAIKRTSGANFDPAWAPGTLVLVNNKAVSLDQVISTDVLLAMENVGAGTGLTYTIPTPQKVGQVVPVFFTDERNHLFAVGDPANPGTLYWAREQNPDSHSDQNSLIVTAGTDPLVAGAQWDNATYLFSTRRQFEIRQQDDGSFRAFPTACEKGLRGWQGLASTPYGIFFVADDGIYLTKGGSEPVSITTDDLKELFPVDQVTGGPGRPIGLGRDVGPIPTPEMGGRPRDLRLTFVDGLLYFDYESSTVENSYRSLVYDPKEGIWFFDRYPGDLEIVRLDEEAEAEGTDTGGRGRRHLLSLGPQVTVLEGTQDLGSPIAWIWYSALVDLGDTRSVKQWGDTILDLDPKGTTVSVTPVFDEGVTVDPAQTTNGTGRQSWILPIRDGAGALSRNMGLRASGSTATGLTLYLWEPAALVKVEDTTSRATDWDDLGVMGAKFVQGIIIRADTHGADKTILVQGDRQTALTLTINHSGEKEVAYPIASSGWTPFVAHLVRLWPSGDPDTWLLLGARWVWEPAPELASEWTTQSTSHDLPGYLHVRDGFFAYSDAASSITFEIFYDGVSVPTTIGASPAYTRVYLVFPSRKGRSVSYRWKSATPFRLYRKDFAVRVSSWGDPRGYQVAMPFGGESRQIGAEI